MRLDCISCVVMWVLLVSVWSPSRSEAKPLAGQTAAQDAEVRQQILRVIDRLLEKRFLEKDSLATNSDNGQSPVQGHVRQKKQDEPSPFFGGDYDYVSRSKKAFLSNDREQDEPSPIFPESKWNDRSKKSEISSDLIDKLITIWKTQRGNSSSRKSRSLQTDEKDDTEKILDILGRNQ